MGARIRVMQMRLRLPFLRSWHRSRLTAWCTALLLALAALLPASAAVPRPGGVEICTTAGIQWLPDPAAAVDGQWPEAAGHCPLCLFPLAIGPFADVRGGGACSGGVPSFRSAPRAPGASHPGARLPPAPSAARPVMPHATPAYPALR